MADDANLTELTVDLLSSYLSHNNVRAEDISGLIASTHSALKALDGASSSAEASASPKEEHAPAVSARKSLAKSDRIISMIDGKPYKVLTRHLTTNGLTPQQYRQRYNLPNDYPMVARDYAERRRALAHSIGLGRRSKQTVEAKEPEASPAKPARKPRTSKKATQPA